MLEPVCPLSTVVRSLSKNRSEVEWVLAEIESQEGWFRFPGFLTRQIAALKIETYPLLYQNETAMGCAPLLAGMAKDEITEWANAIEGMTIEERGAFFEDFMSGVDESLDIVVIPKTLAEEEAARAAFLELPEGERKAKAAAAQFVTMGFLCAFHQSLSVMVHGEKLTSLVKQAIEGNDDAFVKAVQIDRRILTQIPFFRERFERAQFEPWGGDFSDKIAYRLKTPPYRGKIRYKSLWYVFSMLELTGWLDRLTGAELLKVCDEIGLDERFCRIESEKHLVARRREYRKFQQRGTV